MLSFDNLRGQLDIMMKKLSTFTKLFSFVSTIFFIFFYTFQVIVHINDQSRLILYSILLVMILFITIFDVIDLYNHSKYYEYFKKTVMNRIYSIIKSVIVLTSLVLTAYQLFVGEINNNLSIALFILSTLVYILSCIFNITKEVIGAFSKRLLVALKMDLEGNILGTVFKEANFDVDNLKQVYKEDDLRDKIKKKTSESKRSDSNKKSTTNPLSLLSKVFGSYKQSEKIKSLQDEKKLEEYFKKESFSSSRLALNKKKVDALLQEIDDIAFNEGYRKHKDDIYYIHAYLANYNKSRNKMKYLSKASTCVTCLELLKLTDDEDEYMPVIKYTIKTIKE